MVDSQECVQMNLEEFRNRFLQNVERRQQQIHDKKPLGMDDDARTTRNKIEISIIHASDTERQGRIFALSGRTLAARDTAAAHRWLESVDLFAKFIASCHHERNVALQGNYRVEDSDIVVALIDDGVDIYDPLISDSIVGGRSFAYEDNWTKPYYVSESGHGTAMARTILRVCPMAKLYPIRLGLVLSENRVPRIDVKSAALVSTPTSQC
jgi:hypothetical protein